MPVYERERMAMRVMGFYHHLPNEVERPFPQDLYHEEGRKALVEKLADPEQSAELLEQMDNALLSVPLDSEEYKGKAESLSVLHQYVEGTSAPDENTMGQEKGGLAWQLTANSR